MWTAAALQLLDELGPDWDHRGSGAKLSLVRRRSPWLIDVVLMDPTRSGHAANVRVVVDGLVDGGEVLLLNRSTRCYIDTLERPGSAQQIIDHVLGDGLDLLDSWTPERWGAAAMHQPNSARFAEGNANHQARDLMNAAAWQFVLDPGTADPIAPRALEAVRRHAAEKPIDQHDAEFKQRRVRDAERLVEIAGFDADGRLAAMHARAAAKLAATGLDEAGRKRVRRPGR